MHYNDGYLLLKLVTTYYNKRYTTSYVHVNNVDFTNNI